MNDAASKPHINHCWCGGVRVNGKESEKKDSHNPGEEANFIFYSLPGKFINTDVIFR
jgi:hypothetical protein